MYSRVGPKTPRGRDHLEASRRVEPPRRSHDHHLDANADHGLTVDTPMPGLPDPLLAWEDLSAVDRRPRT